MSRFIEGLILGLLIGIFMAWALIPPDIPFPGVR